MTKALLISFTMAVVLLVACEDMNGPGRLELVELIGPNDTLGQATMKVAAEQVIPPKEYRRWYAEVSKCLGMPGSFDAITWYAVPLPWRGRTGYYVGQHSGTIPAKVILSTLHLGDSTVVKHESAHHHLALRGLIKANLAHDSTYFNTRCLTR
jgi:hypothetical protein